MPDRDAITEPEAARAVGIARALDALLPHHYTLVFEDESGAWRACSTLEPADMVASLRSFADSVPELVHSFEMPAQARPS